MSTGFDAVFLAKLINYLVGKYSQGGQKNSYQQKF